MADDDVLDFSRDEDADRGVPSGGGHPRFGADGYDDSGWRRVLRPDEFPVLEPYWAWGEVEPGDTEAFRSVLESAVDERPLQAFLTERPRILAAAYLSGGHGRYVRPQVRLGSEWVADFVLGDASSMGTFWTLVELESPRERMFIASGEWAAKARHSIHQIKTWRRWLQENLDYARKPPPVGVGLVDVEPSPEGLIVIGRRIEQAEAHQWLRRELWKEGRIRMHSYDGLLELVVRLEEQTVRSRSRPTADSDP